MADTSPFIVKGGWFPSTNSEGTASWFVKMDIVSSSQFSNRNEKESHIYSKLFTA